MAYQFKRGQEGFTLIEIISVLVLLGILAAVAVPRFMDMQAAARERAAQATINEIQSRINQTFANNLLRGASCTEALDGTGGIAGVLDPVATASGGPLSDITGLTAITIDATGGGANGTYSLNQGGAAPYTDTTGWSIVTPIPQILSPRC